MSDRPTKSWARPAITDLPPPPPLPPPPVTAAPPLPFSWEPAPEPVTRHIPRHAAPDDDEPAELEPAPQPTLARATSSEPVIIAHAVTMILGALVTAGWVVIPDSTITAIGTVVAFVVATVGAVMARARVSPVQGGLWDAIGDFVTNLVREEIAKRR